MSLREGAAFALLLAVLLLRVLATLRPSPWTWGLDSLADRPHGLQLVGLGLFALALLPPIGAHVSRALSLAGRMPGAILSIAGAIACLAILALARCKNLLLGDSQTYVSAIEKGMRAAGGAHREPLAQGIVTAFHSLIGAPLQIGAQGSFAGAEMLIALGAIAAAALLARRLAPTAPGRALIFAAVMLGGIPQLFAGYAEFYGFALAAILLFAFLGVRSLERGGAGAIPAAAGFAIAALMHAQALFAFPAIAYVTVVAWRSGRRRDAAIAACAVPVIGLLGLALLRYPFAEIGREASRAGSFLPPFGATTRRTAYGALSPAHGIELLNVFLLIAPALPATIALAWRAGTGRTRSWTFLALLACGPVLFALAANPQLGMVRDWDIFALPVAAASLWAAVAAANALRSPDHPARGRAIVGAIVATSALHAAFWLGSNHSPDASRERIRRVATAAPSIFGPQSLGEVWRYIGSADVAAGDPDRASASYRRAIASDPDDRMSYRMLAGIEMTRARRAGRGPEEALAAYHSLLDTDGGARRAYGFLGGSIAALAVHRDDLAMREGDSMIAAEPDHPELLAYRGDLLRRAGRDDDARAAYDAALARDPSLPRARIGLACLAAAAGDPVTAQEQAREALRRTPWSPQAQQFARIVSNPQAASPEAMRRYLFIQ